MGNIRLIFGKSRLLDYSPNFSVFKLNSWALETSKYQSNFEVKPLMLILQVAKFVEIVDKA